MGRGGAQLGKTLKGAGIAPKNIIDSLTVNGNLAQLEKYDKQRNTMADHRAKLFVQATEDRSVENVARRRIGQRWRFFMRQARAQDLQREREALFMTALQTGEFRNVQKVALQEDLMTLDAQKCMVRTGYQTRLEGLIGLYEESGVRRKSEFEGEMKAIRDGMESEMEQIRDRHAAAVKESKSAASEVWAVEQARAAQLMQMFESEREALRNRNLEMIHMLRLSTTQVIEKLEGRFDEAHQSYLEATEERTREFQGLKESDRAMSVEIERQVVMIERTTGAVQHWRKNLHRQAHEWKKMLGEMHTEKASIYAHYQELQERVRRMRSGESSNLLGFSKMSRHKQQELKSQLAMCSRVFQLVEITTKAQTGAERAAGQISNGDEKLELTPAAALTVFIDRYNHARLDLMNVRKEREELRRENKQLSVLLTAYLEGINASKECVDGPNSLLIVNGRTNINQSSRPPRPFRRPPIIEGVIVARAYAAHAQT